MRILLVAPNLTSDSIQPPLGLGFLAASVSPRHEVAIVDGVLDRLDPAGLVRRVRDFRADAVGFQILSYGLAPVLRCLSALRASCPGVVTIAGGPHPTAVPRDTFEALDGRLDYLFQGEGESGLPLLLDALESGATDEESLLGIPGLGFLGKDGQVRLVPARLSDPSGLPMPRWDLMDPRRYPPAPHAAFFREFPVAPVSVSRGCPYPCTFCAGHGVHGKKVRYRPVATVIQEVRLLHDVYGVRELQFIDDNLTYDPAYTLELCAALEALPYRIPWTCPNGVRLDRVDRAVVERMRNAGCYSIAVGIESGSERILAKVMKGLSLDTVRRQVGMLIEAGLETRGFFVLGFPTETRDEMEATVRLALDLPLDIVQFMLFHPLPGTPLYDEIVATQGPGVIDWNAATLGEPAYSPDGIGRAELKSIQRNAFLRFYLRPKSLVTLLAQIRGYRHGVLIVRRVARWLS